MQMSDNDYKEIDYKKLEAMRKEYSGARMSEEQIELMKSRMQDAKRQKEKRRRKRFFRNLSAVAAAAALFVLLPNTSRNVAHAMSSIPLLGGLVEVITFRDYQYESDRHMADISVPEIVAEKRPDEENAAADPGVQENLNNAAREINGEIQQITEELVREFEESLKEEEGFQDVVIESEVMNSTKDYFTLKLLCYQGAGSGMQWNYFYTIDLKTGKRLALKDLFLEGADYITPVSEEIKRQMREQMSADENVHYWLDDEIEEWNFKAITDETSFYVNEKGNVVISFHEGDVAPMYMGVVEFEIPGEILAEIRR